MSQSVLFVQPRHKPMADLMEGRGIAVHRHFGGPSDAVFAGPAGDAQVIVLSGPACLSNAFLARMKNLRALVCPSAGYDCVDLDWCDAHGVAVCNVPGANAPEVAEYAVALALAAWRRVGENDQQVREGGWRAVRPIVGRSFFERRVGIVGLGVIGVEIARRLEPFGVAIRWWGPRAKSELPWERMPDLAALAAWCDILIVAARAGEDNRRLIDADVIAAVGPEGLIVNIARGSLIDEAALVAALREGRLGQAALDVFEQEPTAPEAVADVPNLLTSPHLAGVTRECIARLFTQAADNIQGYFGGAPLRWQVNAAR